jgi:haloalkane dehalogenase
MAEISATDPYERKRLAVLDSEIAYVDTGEGDPIVFLHGNPTSSYLWRNVIPYVASLGRCLAPDLIGMGDSGPQPSGAYRLADHVRYIDAWLDGVGATQNVTFVIHDWGSAIGFHRAHRFPEQVKGIAYMEGIVGIFGVEPPAESVFALARTPEGERKLLDTNYFVDEILGRTVQSAEAMEVYRRPFRTAGASRMPTLQWPREVPFESGPADNVELISAYSAWLPSSDVPKLFVRAEPGAILREDRLEFARSFANQTEVTVTGRHFIQEESPDAIGEALADWYARL